MLDCHVQLIPGVGVQVSPVSSGVSSLNSFVALYLGTGLAQPPLAHGGHPKVGDNAKRRQQGSGGIGLTHAKPSIRLSVFAQRTRSAGIPMTTLAWILLTQD
ncbi:hypothetical protein XU18_2488 [Perkinsela sp. CCAP 1560/4]|nr:hypothetical protein XU18_2630 [Perkinsela sp. CCAP 1560/4]KNH06728.1 hypothetical protein XU18_2488 [Perkinsela sp. CCAP 1560/4]|eukprot:KNH06531.1 hypothetical protein XU18_2630 [Perkinsela sp. CCAP 1560/4]